jgi:dephospho-CoA kinase
VALTGGIATGKSHCLRTLAMLGAATIDADALARDVVRRGSEGLEAVVDRFGREILGSDGELDRPALASRVFSDLDARRDLEAIIHPRVYTRIQTWLAALAPDAVGIADVPLLYETRKERDFDRVIVASCPPETQIERVMARDHLTREQATQRLSAQLPITEKARLADYVIDTTGPVSDTDAQVARVWALLRSPA